MELLNKIRLNVADIDNNNTESEFKCAAVKET